MESLYWVLTFLVISIVAAVLGFTGIIVAAVAIAKVIFIIALILFIASFILYLTKTTFHKLTWVFTFFIIAMVAGLLGFTNIAMASIEVAKIVFAIFLVLFIGSLVLYLMEKSKN